MNAIGGIPQSQDPQLRGQPVLSVLFGPGFMLMPAQLVTIYGVEVNDTGRYIAQLYGATLFGLGLLNWFAREFADGSVQRAVLTANVLTATLGFLFSLLGQLGGVSGVNALGWSTVLLYLLLALAFGYLRFMRPS